MRIIANLVDEIQQHGYSISDVLRIQQKYHESRRWSVYDVIGMAKCIHADERDRAALWHAARAELTTQPAGIRLAVDGVKLAQELADANPLGSDVAHIAAAWSARYWLEEEAHHEVAYGLLLEMAGLKPIAHDEVTEHRGFFPSDNYARVCMLQACVEIEAAVAYGEMAKTTHDPIIREIFLRIMKDEVQHREYFVSFAKALVDSGVYPIKDVLSMAYTWIRPDGGETLGSTRREQTAREGFVNWWEHVVTDDTAGIALRDDQIRSESLQAKKERSVLVAVQHATGIPVKSTTELKRAYLASLTTNDADRIRHTINPGIQQKAIRGAEPVSLQ